MRAVFTRDGLLLTRYDVVVQTEFFLRRKRYGRKSLLHPPAASSTSSSSDSIMKHSLMDSFKQRFPDLVFKKK